MYINESCVIYIMFESAMYLAYIYNDQIFYKCIYVHASQSTDCKDGMILHGISITIHVYQEYA